MAAVGDVWYRVEDGSACLWVRTFAVEKVTMCGVRLSDGITRRLVLIAARKRFACPTLAEAVESFIRRKARQRRILSAHLQRVECALEAARQAQADGITPDGVEYGNHLLKPLTLKVSA